MLDNVIFGSLTSTVQTWIGLAISAAIPVIILILGAIVGYDVYKKLLLATEVYDGSSGSGADSKSRDYWNNHPDAIDADDDPKPFSDNIYEDYRMWDDDE